jgi:putative CocE/NonD family hydrolase
LWWFVGNLDRARNSLLATMARQKGKSSIAITDALNLVSAYQFHQLLKSIQPLRDSLIAEEDARRYLIDNDVLIKTPDGASIAAMIYRQRSAALRLPTLLGFTIYANNDLDDARLTAAHGYVAAVAYSRGKDRSPDSPVPYERDGDDARAVIDWISKQPWSDGRVGMYGGSYNGFTQWAAAKHRPAALKAMMPPVAAAPGIDVPMEGNIFLNFIYPWPLYTTTIKGLDEANYGDFERWNRLNRNWYLTGKSYRQLDHIDGTPNPFFRRWLDHPSYDKYWQSMIPFREDFAGINIPILSVDGYLGGQGISALYYFTEHQKYNFRAEHYFVIGPYNHFGAQGVPETRLAGYEIDPVARIDIEELRYQWFDYVLRSGKKPELLKDKVNYEVMGANEWKHAPSVAAMSNESIRFYMTAVRSGETYQLAQQKPSNRAFITQTIDFRDRKDVDRSIPGLVVDKTLDTDNGIVFVSDPMPQATEISGLFSGQLDFIVNQQDMDFKVALYELMSSGEYFRLSYYMTRASFARDRSRRELLTPGRRQQLAFKSVRLTSRRFQAGSRLAVVLSINKQPDLQINYGSGKDVSDEDISDAKEPLEIKWFNDSFVTVPIWRSR